MTDAFKDLDALVPDDKNVRIGGKNYTIPGDLPLEIYIRVNKASEREADNEQEAIDLMVGAMVDLFAWRYRDKPEEQAVRQAVGETLKSRGLRFNTRLIQSIYGEDIQEPGEDDEASGPTS